jgi:hypothetical protein
MKPDFLYLIQEHNNHSAFLNTKGMVEALRISYEQGIKDGNEEVLNWLSKMDYLSDNINYIKEEWKNQKS